MPSDDFNTRAWMEEMGFDFAQPERKQEKEYWMVAPLAFVVLVFFSLVAYLIFGPEVVR